ncbi:Diphthine methyltransferase [Dinochytrium kinnereticum]|nr:Diphthine methyltransferase [Dinochytrium kinnereticum]
MTTLVKLDTEYCADSVEFCPCLDQDIVAVGTYQLLKQVDSGSDETTAETRRTGRLLLFKVEDRPSLESPVKLKELHREETGAILDMKWCEIEDGSASLAMADSLGNISIYTLKDETLQQSFNYSNGLEKVLCLSLDWSPRLRKDRSSAKLAVSQSDGTINVLGLSNERGLASTSTWKAHDFEAWIAAFDAYDENVIYSGGDDSRLKRWDMRMEPPHSAGVCSIESHPSNENIIGTGSYDEKFMIWDKRSMRSPLLECHVGGGVWRFRWHPIDPSLVLTASMQNGFHVIKLDFESNEMGITETWDMEQAGVIPQDQI